MNADVFYLFRHALVRTAAYELQPLGERAILHLHALELLRELRGDPANPAAIQPWAEDLLPHVHGARDAEGADAAELRRLDIELTFQAGCYAFTRFENEKALVFLKQVQEAPDAPTRMRVGAALRRGGIYHWRAHQDEMNACREAALEFARQAGDESLEAIALSHLATGLYGGDRVGEVEGLYRRALEIGRKQNYPMQLAVTLGNLADELARQERLDEAVQCYREALELFRKIGDTQHESVTTCNLGQLRVQQGMLDEGEALLERALQLAVESGERRSEGTTLGRLASVALDRGDEDRAEDLLQRSLAIHEDVGNRVHAAYDLMTRGRLRARQGSTVEAIDDYHAAAAIHTQAGWPAKAREAEEAARALQA